MGRLTVETQQLDELDILIAEATAIRRGLVIEACERVKLAIMRGMRPIRDDAAVVQQFIAERQQHNRFGQ